MPSTLKVPVETQIMFEGMSLASDQVNEIKALRAEVEDIKAGIESEHVNNDADFIRVFEIALRRACQSVRLRRAFKVPLK